jgi:hypothetical protein
MGVVVSQVKYEPVVLEAYAQTLYNRASVLSWWYAVKNAIYGVVLAFLVLALIGAVIPVNQFLDGAGVRARHVDHMLWLFPLIGAVRGWRRGYVEGWNLRLEAQRALCQVQIEFNTRRKSED